MEQPVRRLFSLALIVPFSACSLAANDVFNSPVPELAVGAAALSLIYYDDLPEKAPEDLTVKDAADSVPQRVKNTVNKTVNKARDNVKVTAKKVKEWWQYEPPVLSPHAVPDSYCYRTQGDVLCYRAPMPGWETRLVGYQGTFAEAPPVAMMQPLPGKSVDESKLPENRVANAKPVFIDMPPEAKEAPKTLEELTPQDVHENAADPNTAPQL